MKEDRKSWRESREGAYLLRTNLKAETAQQTVVQVHAVDRGRILPGTEERAFHSPLVSSTGTARVKAHVLVAFLGYALWVTLKHLLKRRPGGRS
jgi:hypothetical protein